MKLLKKNKAKAIDKDKAAIKPRSRRVNPEKLESISFSVVSDSAAKQYAIANISSSGIGLITKSEFRVGQILNGNLVVREVRVPLQIQVMHVRENFCGARFELGQPEVEKVLLEHFHLQFLASGFQPVGELKSKKIGKVQNRWLVDGHGGELYYTMANNVVQYYQLVFLNYFVEGGREQITRTGRILNAAKKLRDSHDMSEVKVDAEVDLEVIAKARTFLRALSEIPSQEAIALLQFFKPKKIKAA